jgi:autotransporter-associated beta strand protein
MPERGARSVAVKWRGKNDDFWLANGKIACFPERDTRFASLTQVSKIQNPNEPMKLKNLIPGNPLTSFIVCASIPLLSPVSQAQTNGTWSVNNSGNWSTPGNWTGGNVASGATATANFSTLNITANRTVTLDGPFTIGTLTAQDLTTASHDWIFDGTGPLTLDNGLNQPVITAGNTNRNTTISASLAGSNGFSKNGQGAVVLSGDNSGLSGTMNLLDVTGANNAGVILASNTAIGGITSIAINGTGTTSGQFLGIDGGVTLGSGVAITLNSQGGNSAPSGGIRGTGSNTEVATIAGPINITLNSARIGNNSAKRLDLTGPITAGVGVTNIFFRFGKNEGVRITNPLNSWTANTTHSEETLWFEPGSLPLTTNLRICGSNPGTIQTSGTFNRGLGTAAGEVQFTLSAGRAQGFGARGGDLTMNFGGAGAEVLFDTIGGAPESRIRTNTLVLNNSTADSKITLVNPLNLNGGSRNIQVSANVAELTGGITGGAFDITKTGAGTLLLSGPITHAGNTAISGGTLRLAGADNRLPTTSTLALTGSGTLDLTTTNQTLAGLTTPNGLNASLTVIGSGALTLNGAQDLQIGPGTTVDPGNAVTLDLAALPGFTYDNNAGIFRVGLKPGSSNSGSLGQIATATLAASNTINASVLAVGDATGNNHGGTATLLLGGANILNVDSIDMGTSGRSSSNLLFDPARINPTATFRGADGTSPVGSWRVGQTVTFNASTWTDNVNFSAGTIDASVTSLVIGTADLIGTQANRGGLENGSFTMGNGTLQASTLILGRASGNAASTINSTMAGNGTFTLDHASGLLKATTITLAENTVLAGGTGARSTSGTLNLTNGTIEATTIQLGAQTGNATTSANFNWADGTLRNTAGNDLLIDSIPVTLATGSHLFDATGSNSITLNASSPLAGTDGLVKTGTGSLILNAPSTFTGTADVQQGTLAINNSVAADVDFLVDAAATLSLANLTLGTDEITGKALDIDGNLIIAGPVNILLPPGDPVGTTNILDHGSISGTGNLTANYRNISFNSGASTTSMTVGAGLPLTWTGANGDSWDLNSSLNWEDAGNNPEKFYWWDAVTFDEDGALVQPTVTLNGELRPASVTVNSTTDYNLGGSGALVGPFNLSKNGTSTLTLGGSHSFNGGISIQGGTLKPGGNQSLGANGQVISISAGATLDANGAMNASRDYATVISGTGVGGLGAIVNSGADLFSGIGSITLAADATIGGTGRWDMRPITDGTAFVDLADNTLTKIGSNTIALVDGSFTSAGTVEINEGILTMSRMNVSGTGNLEVNTGGTLSFENYSSGLIDKPVAISDGTLELIGSNNFTLDSTLALTGTANVNVAGGRVFSLNGAVSGTGGLTKNGNGNLTLLETNNYAGTTTISAGALQVGAQSTTGTLGSGPVINDSTLILNRSDLSYTVANEISGTGALTVGQNSGGSVDAVVTLTGTNTFAGNITVLSGGVRIQNVAALGTGPKIITLTNGTNGRPQFYLDGSGGNITVPAGIDFRTSSPVLSLPAIGNLAGDNVIEGNFTLQSGGGATTMSVIGGSLTVNGNIAANTSLRTLNLGGTIGAPGFINGVISNGTHPVGVIMAGPNTWTFAGNNSYTGTTTINAGTLLINGDQTSAIGLVNLNSGGTLGGTGTVGGTVASATGSTIAPGTSIGTLTTSGPINLSGTLAVELNATTSDRLTVGGALDLDGASLQITELATPGQPVYIIASYAGLDGTFSSISGMPSGYGLVYNYDNLNQIALVAGAASPFGTWIDGFVSLTDPADKLPGADPDDDGASNLLEFALNGDPTDGGNNGLSATLIQDATAPAGDELTLIIAARRGASFGAGPNGTRTANIDGVKYAVEGSLDLVFPGGNVTHVGASDTAPAATGLPSLASEDWEYHTFSLDSSESLPGKGFLRVKVEE